MHSLLPHHPIDRRQLEEREDAQLAPWAARSSRTRGRTVPERPDPLRTEYQRDRDRILHCAAFRRLEYKTQVFVTHEGDLFRTRLTHTLEAAQIARTLARSLGLNGDLTEAIALAHDLGHTPFGHIGERVLAELLAEEGGFEHNAQSLRVVELLEERFHDRPGLNLTWEVRAGIARHSRSPHPDVRRYFEPGTMPSLEAQAVDLADEIAYNHHDLDDAMSMGLLGVEMLAEVDWLAEAWERARLPEGSDPRHLKNRWLGALIDMMVHDALETTAAAIEREGIDSTEEAAGLTKVMVGFSPAMRERQDALRGFLARHVYRHPRTLQMQNKAARFFRRLYELYMTEPELLPLALQARLAEWGVRRVLADHLSGLTDRQCMEEYRSHFETGAH